MFSATENLKKKSNRRGEISGYPQTSLGQSSMQKGMEVLSEFQKIK